jgi:hypothetical protein
MEKPATLVKLAAPPNVIGTVPFTIGGVTDDERQEVQRIIEAHEHTVAICRACAETTRDLAWEVKRGAVPPPETLGQTIAEADRVLADLGQVELAIARMKASLW